MKLVFNIFVFWVKSFFIKEKYSIYLDDERMPKTNRKWTIVRNYNDFTALIQKKGLPSYISFDHDLGEEKTGYDCAKWLVEYCIDNNKAVPEFNVHSANGPGGDNIRGLLTSYNKFKGK